MTEMLDRPHEILRSKKEIAELLAAVRRALAYTPATNAFGESNAEDIAAMERDAEVLQAALEGRYTDEAHNEEVGFWLSLPETAKLNSLMYDYFG